MKRLAIIILTTFITLCTQAQKVFISGVVTDERTGSKIAHANVMASDGSVSVITNDDGFFTLKTDERQKSVTVSHLGYRSQQIHLNKEVTTHLHIRLMPTTIALQEVVVWKQDPRQLVNIAIQKIPENYGQQPVLYNCFYRESAMKRKHYIYVAEGVVDMYKTTYKHRNINRDRVAIVKGRRLLSPKKNDTLGIKVMGGPALPIQLDIVKNQDFLLNNEDLENYTFRMEPSTTIADRLQYVVSITPHTMTPYALYNGRFYIDRETLAFTRAELSLDMSDREKATRMMLVHKPLGVRFKPKELTCLIDYTYQDGVTRIHYVRNTFRFNCDWKRKLFSTSFAAFCEMVVTDRETTTHPITGRKSFDQRDAFYDRVEYFRDPDFWKDYNIIEPTETLDNAINKIIKKYKL